MGKKTALTNAAIKKDPQRGKGLSSAKESRDATRRDLETMRRVTKVMGKFLRSQLRTTIREGESWLVTTLRTLREEPPTPLKRCDIKFENTDRAAMENSALLRNHGDDFQRLTEHQRDKIL